MKMTVTVTVTRNSQPSPRRRNFLFMMSMRRTSTTTGTTRRTKRKSSTTTTPISGPGRQLQHPPRRQQLQQLPLCLLLSDPPLQRQCRQRRRRSLRARPLGGRLSPSYPSLLGLPLWQRPRLPSPRMIQVAGSCSRKVNMSRTKGGVKVLTGRGKLVLKRPTTRWTRMVMMNLTMTSIFLMLPEASPKSKRAIPICRPWHHRPPLPTRRRRR
mmetsp:Transcript_42512/g.102400  ORF Transcript_42512/g.102400 Transcript_42512/m.102400 type:complete len:212 (-) Transcript_42512:602-1237(-)